MFRLTLWSSLVGNILANSQKTIGAEPTPDSLMLMNVFPKVIFIVVCVSLSACGTESGVNQPQPTTHRLLVSSPEDYTAWPGIVRANDSTLVVLYTSSDEHMGPDGRIEAVRSEDDGESWSEPYVIYDTPLDERESGVAKLRDGSLIANVWATRHTPESYAAMGQGAYYDDVVADWVDHVSTAEYRDAPVAGGSLLRSTDNGLTWVRVGEGPDSIHGGIELADGRIMVAAYRKTRDYVTIHVADRWSDPWTTVAEIRSPQPDSLRLGEPSILQLPSGRIIVMMRTTTKPYNDSDDRCYLWEAYSDDGGATWSEPFRTPLWGFPPHLLLLDNGSVLVAYGHRRPPFGQRAAISADGVTWNVENEIVLRDDAPNKDLGYPASVQLQDGRVLTVYYQSHPSDSLRPAAGPPPDRHKPDIIATIWDPMQPGTLK